MNDEDTTFSITLDDDVTINLDSISSNTGTYSISDSTFSLSDIGNDITLDSGIIYNTLDKFIDPDEVENMCKEYPALFKVWRNFKSVYDMTLQDYKGKKEQDEI